MLSNVIIEEMPVASKMISEVYSNDLTAIFKSNMRLNGEYTFSSYGFIIPTGKMPPFLIDNKMFTMQQDEVFPINPGQLLKSTFEQSVDSFFAIHIDSEFMGQIAKSAGKHSPIFFRNEGLPQSRVMEGLIKHFIYECNNKQPGYQLMLQSISMELTIEILRQTVVAPDNKVLFAYKHDIKKAIAFIEERYQDNITLDAIAKEVNISPYHLSRVFKAETGKTPFEFLADVKIQHAKRLLAGGKFSMTEISSQCGFSNASHFSVVFKKKTGLTPSAFQKYK